MPAKVDKLKLGSKMLKRSAKLLECQVEQIKQLHAKGEMSITAIAKKFWVSKRTVQFILFPERKERNIELRKARGGSKIYYNKEKHTVAMKKHREHKKIILKVDENEKKNTISSPSDNIS